jgi:glycosyltransferase involved in cell wall biosynthesis
MSTDNTKEIIKKTIKDDSRFILVENTVKLYPPGNYNQIINGKNLNDDEICVEVNGDDWLANPNVFTKINQVYQDPNIWMTSGSFKYHDGRQGFNRPLETTENIRKKTFTLSHLRTWKSWLWKKIKDEDLKDFDGVYWPVAGDLSFMWPMIEMAGLEHFKFIHDVLYIYNEGNPLNDHKVNFQKVITNHKIIANKPPYNKI